MDFGPTDQQRHYRDEVRRELRRPAVRAALADLPAGDSGGPELRRLYRVLGERALLGPHWPVEYGGQGRTFAEGIIVTEELVRAGIPDTLHISTIQIVGQFLLMVGTAEQKRRYLPGMARGEDFVSVLFTEPDVGSDLGSLSAAAQPDGDGYLISGTKVFSLKTKMASYGLCPARTAPGGTKYGGISLFMLDMTAPGIRVTPIPSIFDEPFYRVELDQARVDRGALLGAEGDGWSLLSKVLAVERTGIDYYLKAERWLGAALACVAGRPAVSRDDGGLLEEVGRHVTGLHASRLLAWEMLGGIMAGQTDEIAAAVAKYYTSELASAIGRWGGRLPDAADRVAGPAATVLDEGYLEAPGLTLSGGASELMLQLVAAAIDTSGQEPV
jgi:alkylation response protein AidB-like acyl-CoA dehydrogenase